MRNPDSVDLLGRQDRVLEQLFEAWRGHDPEGCDRGSKDQGQLGAGYGRREADRRKALCGLRLWRTWSAP